MAKKTTLNEKADIYQKRDNLSEREKIKTMTREQKWTYFKDYYLLKSILGIVLVSFVVYLLYTTLGPKPDTLLYIAGINLNIDSEVKDTFTQTIEEHFDADSKDQTIIFDSTNTISSDANNYAYSMTSTQKLAALIMSKDLDLIIVDKQNFDMLVQQGYFTNLSDALPTATFHELSDSFIMGKSEEDTKSYPYGITLDRSDLFKTLFPLDNIKLADGVTKDDLLNTITKDFIVGIVTNSQRKETAVDTVEFLYGLNN